MGVELGYGPFSMIDLDPSLVLGGQGPRHGRGDRYVYTEHAVFCVPEDVTYGVTTQDGHTGYFDVPAGTVGTTTGALPVAGDFRATVSVLQMVSGSEIWESRLLAYTRKTLMSLDEGSGEVTEAVTPWGVGLSGSVHLRGTDGRRDEFYIVAASGQDWMVRLTAFGSCIGRTEMDFLDSILSESFVMPNEDSVGDSGWKPLSLREV